MMTNRKDWLTQECIHCGSREVSGEHRECDPCRAKRLAKDYERSLEKKSKPKKF